MSIVVRLRRAPSRGMAVVVASLLGALPAGCATAPGSVAMRVPVIGRDGSAAPGDGPAASAAPSGSAWSEWGSTADAAPAAGSGAAQDWRGRHVSSQADPRHVTLLVGARQMEKDTWIPVENQTAFGLEFDETDLATGHGYEFGVAYSDDDDSEDLLGVDLDIEGETAEVYGGYRYTFRAGEEGYHPYVGLGVSVIRAEFEGSVLGVSASDDDVSPGAYVRAGIGWDVGTRMRIGLDYRHLFATDIDLDLGGGSVDGNANFDQLALSLGWAF